MMSQNYLTYIIILWFLLQLLVGIDCQMMPKQRQWHTATHVDKKLYILGGFSTADTSVGTDFFYLDTSAPFNTKGILWNDLKSINMVPGHSGAASVIGGTNNNTIFIYGGYAPGAELVYTFDP